MTARFVLLSLLITIADLKTLSAQELSREFPAAFCRFTLPGKSWTWDDLPAAQGMIGVATHTDGTKLILTALPSSAPGPNSFQRFEESLLESGGRDLVKRGSRVTDFKGVQCLEFTGTMFGKRSMAL